MTLSKYIATSSSILIALATSLDGRGHATDNVFVERIWRTIKYQEVYLKEYASGVGTYSRRKRFFDYYNCDTQHQGLGNQTAWEVYRSRGRKRPAAGIERGAARGSNSVFHFSRSCSLLCPNGQLRFRLNYINNR
jgi:putative transposase